MSRSLGKRWFFVLLCLCGAFLISGCAERVEMDGAVVFCMPAWTWLTAAALGLVFAVLAVRAASQGWRLWLVTALCWFLFVPGLYGDRVILTKDSIESLRGFPFSSNSVAVRFDDVKQLIISTYKDSKGRLKTRLVFEGKGSQRRMLPAGDLVRAAMPELLQIFDQRHIPIIR
ncbi:MAG TPA: hypothetical protein PKO06_03245 [Candidatus Ozemobacteraceae bacterium]|nr:hypothetical protein [Candidatus Ozemobacteraceae bacterium]